ALLPLVLERPANERRAQRVGVGGLVRDDEVLAAGLADEARIRAVVADVLAHSAPHALEHLGRAGEVDARELLVPEDALGELSSTAAHHVDDAGRQTR